MIPGFLQYFGIGTFEACRGFQESLGNLSTDKLIERCTLVLLWLASSPELKGLYYRFNSTSVLKFKHHWFKKTDSKKLKTQFFQTSAVCNFLITR